MFLVDNDHLELVTLKFKEAHLLVTNLKWSPLAKDKKNNNNYVLATILSWEVLLWKWCTIGPV